MRRLALLLITSWICCNQTLYADVFVSQDAQGNTTYSDVPTQNAQRVPLSDENSATNTTPTPPVTTAPAPGMPPTTGPITVVPPTTTAPPGSTPVLTPGAPITGQTPPPGVPANQEYKTFAIVSPKDQETIQNQPTIPIEIKIDPELQPGDKIQILVDGKLWGAPYTKTKMEVEGVERGSHQFSAVLIDKDQRIIKQSNSITLFVHRASTNAPALQKNPNVSRPAF